MPDFGRFRPFSTAFGGFLSGGLSLKCRRQKLVEPVTDREFEYVREAVR